MGEIKVNIKLISTQSDGYDKEQTEIMTDGEFEVTDTGYMISYEESEATGFEGSVTSLEVFGDNKVVMVRSGEVSSNLIMEMGEKHHCVYGTPYGVIEVGVDARRIDVKLDENGGNLFIHYVIDVNSGYVGDFEISVDVTPTAQAGV